MSRLVLDMWIPGRPAPQGSKHARPIYRGRGEAREFTGKVAQVESSKSGVNEWRTDVRVTAERIWRQPPLDVALIVYFEFVLRRPISAPKRRTPLAVKRPDTSKLVRATEDALTSAGVYRDDSLIVRLVADKRIAEIGEPTGCRIQISLKVPAEAGNDRPMPHARGQEELFLSSGVAVDARTSVGGYSRYPRSSHGLSGGVHTEIGQGAMP